MNAGLHAAGKVILLGDHAAVHGQPALAAGLSQGLRAARLEPAPLLRVIVPAWGLAMDEEDEGPMGAAFRVLRRVLPECPGGFDLEVAAALPVGAGLGSSAALAVLAARALGRVSGVDLDDRAVNDAAYEMERVFHGAPSGLDNTVATWGGVCLFAGGDDAPCDAERLTDRAVRLAVPAPRLLIAASGIPRETRRMVEQVSGRLIRDPGGTGAAFDRIGDCVRDGAAALCEDDQAALGDAMNRNHEELRALDLSVPQLDRLVSLARKAGSFGAKLTGGGGGGCVVALPGPTPDAVLRAWSEGGFVCWDTAALDAWART